MNDLADKLKTLREANGWSQAELASRAGVSQSSIHYIESGTRKNPGIACLQKLADVLNISLLELIGSKKNAAGEKGAQKQYD